MRSDKEWCSRYTVDPWTTCVLGVPIPWSWKSECNFWFPQNLTTVVPWYLQWIGYRPSLDIKIHSYSSLLYKMAQNNVDNPPSTSKDSQLWIENTVVICGWLNPQMRKPEIRQANCIFIEKNPPISWPAYFKPILFKDPMYFFLVKKKCRSQSSIYHTQLKHHKDIHQNVNNSNNNLHIFSAYYVPGRLK